MALLPAPGDCKTQFCSLLGKLVQLLEHMFYDFNRKLQLVRRWPRKFVNGRVPEVPVFVQRLRTGLRKEALLLQT